MLCGISTSFPVLSPNRRQVAHALLTRPPLFHPRRDFTVRLECVMHAASVHPEPGSNSLKNCISTDVSIGCYQLIRVICLLNYLLELVKKFKRIFGVSLYFASFKLVHMIVVQFSMSFVFLLRSPRQPVYYITSAPLCQEVFESFFEIFLISFFLSLASLRQLRYYIIPSPLCQGVF